MSWLWIYITLMEWVGIVLVVKALGNEQYHIEPKKAGVYFLGNMLYYAAFMYFGLPQICSVIGYVLLYAYIYWCYHDGIIKTLAMCVMGLIILGVVELLLSQGVYYFVPLDLADGWLEAISSTLLVVVSALLSKLKIYRLMGLFERWDVSYFFVAFLSLMIFAPVVVLRAFKELVVAEYFYITVCILVMWFLISKIQKNKIENQLRKKYLESFTEIISQIRRRQHKVKNQFDTAFGMYRLYDNYDELVAKQKEFLGRIWDYELPTDAIVLEEPAVVALIYEKINEAIEEGIEVHTIFSCSMLHRGVSDVIWVQILGTLLDNAIEAEEEFDGQKKMWIEIQEQKGNAGKVSIYIANAYYKKSQDELEQLFEYGYSTKGEGRGIGLYDVKMLVHKNKGDLIVQNGQRDGGDCFELWIVI